LTINFTSAARSSALLVGSSFFTHNSPIQRPQLLLRAGSFGALVCPHQQQAAVASPAAFVDCWMKVHRRALAAWMVLLMGQASTLDAACDGSTGIWQPSKPPGSRWRVLGDEQCQLRPLFDVYVPGGSPLTVAEAKAEVGAAWEPLLPTRW
jgi:hypothetical protein